MNKKFKFTSLLFLIFLFVFNNRVWAEEEQDIKVWVDGNYVLSDVDPFIYKDRTLVPIRFVGQELGYKVDWINEERKVIVEEGETTLELFIDSPIMYKNGQAVKLDTEPMIKEDRTFVPVRFIAEAMDKHVDYSHIQKVAIIGDNFIENQAHPVRVYIGEEVQETDLSVDYITQSIYRGDACVKRFERDQDIRQAILNEINGVESVEQSAIDVYLDGRHIYTMVDPIYKEGHLMFPAFKTAESMYGSFVWGGPDYGKGWIDYHNGNKNYIDYVFIFPRNEYVYNIFSKKLEYAHEREGYVNYIVEPIATTNELYLDYDTYLFCFTLSSSYNEQTNSYFLKKELFLNPFGYNPASKASFTAYHDDFYNPESSHCKDPYDLEGFYEKHQYEVTNKPYVYEKVKIEYYCIESVYGIEDMYSIIKEIYPDGEDSYFVVLVLNGQYNPNTKILEYEGSDTLLYSGGEPVLEYYYEDNGSYIKKGEDLVDSEDKNIYLKKINK